MCAVLVRCGEVPTWADAFLQIQKQRPIVVLNENYASALTLWQLQSKQKKLVT